MADGTTIEWTDATWNPVTGCAVVSPGCTNCYAMRLAGTRLRHIASRAGLTRESKAGPVWTGETRLNKAELTKPLHWRRPRHIFVCAHGDLFAESVPDDWIDRVFAVMALAPQHTFQVLTKRAGRMQSYFAASPWRRVKDAAFEIIPGDVFDAYDRADQALAHSPLRNVWLGVSVEDQARAQERVPDLLETPAAVRFVSAEPLLGRVDFRNLHVGDGAIVDALNGRSTEYGEPDDGLVAPIATRIPRLNWIVVGGESGAGARPMHPAWARSIRDQCAEAGVPFFHKQNGEWAIERPRPGGDLGGDMRSGVVRHVCADRQNDGHFRAGDVHMRRVGKARAGRLLDGREHNDMPEGAR